MDVLSWDLEGLSPGERFFHLAQAYLDCSQCLFNSMIDKSLTATFSHAQSATFLFEHSLELFLKASIIQTGKPLTNTHDLQHLYNEFKNLYQGNKFKFEGDIDDFVSKDHLRPYSKYNRYPINNSGKSWNVNSFFDLNLYANQLNLFKRDYERLIPYIKKRY